MDSNIIYVAGSLVIVSLLVLVIVEALPRSKVPIIPSFPIQPVRPKIGGCAGTRWGCCPDGMRPRADPLGTNCDHTVPSYPVQPVRPIRPIPARVHHTIGGCAGTRWGCCSDGVTAKNSFFDTC